MSYADEMAKIILENVIELAKLSERTGRSLDGVLTVYLLTVTRYIRELRNLMDEFQLEDLELKLERITGRKDDVNDNESE